MFEGVGNRLLRERREIVLGNGGTACAGSAGGLNGAISTPGSGGKGSGQLG